MWSCRWRYFKGRATVAVLTTLATEQKASLQCLVGEERCTGGGGRLSVHSTAGYIIAGHAVRDVTGRFSANVGQANLLLLRQHRHSVELILGAVLSVQLAPSLLKCMFLRYAQTLRAALTGFYLEQA